MVARIVHDTFAPRDQVVTNSRPIDLRTRTTVLHGRSRRFKLRHHVRGRAPEWTRLDADIAPRCLLSDSRQRHRPLLACTFASDVGGEFCAELANVCFIAAENHSRLTYAVCASTDCARDGAIAERGRVESRGS